MSDKKLEEILRVISLCASIQSSSANPFEVDIIEKLQILKKHLPDWEFLDELLLDSEAIFHSGYHKGPDTRYALIISLESTEHLDDWVRSRLP